MTAKIATTFEKRQDRTDRREAFERLKNEFDVINMDEDTPNREQLLKAFVAHAVANGDSVQNIFKGDEVPEVTPRTFLLAKESTVINQDTLKNIPAKLDVAIVADTHNCTVPAEVLREALNDNQEIWLVNLKEQAPAQPTAAVA